MHIIWEETIVVCCFLVAGISACLMMYGKGKKLDNRWNIFSFIKWKSYGKPKKLIKLTIFAVLKLAFLISHTSLFFYIYMIFSLYTTMFECFIRIICPFLSIIITFSQLLSWKNSIIWIRKIIYIVWVAAGRVVLTGQKS